MKLTGTSSGHLAAAPVAAPTTPWRSVLARAVEAAEHLSARPGRLLLRMLAAIAALAAVFTGFGLVLLGDQAAFYREGMPGTWLSALLLLATAAAALAVHRRVGVPRGRDFWSLSAIVFAALAVNELTQPTVFLSKWLHSEHAIGAPAPFNDVDSLLVWGLLLGCAALLARHSLVLLRHRRALGLMAAGVALGFASQTLDTVVEPTRWEFVAEECLKLAAVPTVLAGYLTALKDSRGAGMRVATSQQSDASSAPNTQPATTSVG